MPRRYCASSLLMVPPTLSQCGWLTRLTELATTSSVACTVPSIRMAGRHQINLCRHAAGGKAEELTLPLRGYVEATASPMGQSLSFHSGRAGLAAVAAVHRVVERVRPCWSSRQLLTSVCRASQAAVDESSHYGRRQSAPAVPAGGREGVTSAASILMNSCFHSLVANGWLTCSGLQQCSPHDDAATAGPLPFGYISEGIVNMP